MVVSKSPSSPLLGRREGGLLIISPRSSTLSDLPPLRSSNEGERVDNARVVLPRCALGETGSSLILLVLGVVPSTSPMLISSSRKQAVLTL